MNFVAETIRFRKYESYIIKNIQELFSKFRLFKQAQCCHRRHVRLFTFGNFEIKTLARHFSKARILENLSKFAGKGDVNHSILASLSTSARPSIVGQPTGSIPSHLLDQQSIAGDHGARIQPGDSGADLQADQKRPELFDLDLRPQAAPRRHCDVQGDPQEVVQSLSYLADLQEVQCGELAGSFRNRSLCSMAACLDH